ncbi:MAG: serine hydrolase domain-containing protein, partial [Polyangiaceae bacterium]
MVKGPTGPSPIEVVAPEEVGLSPAGLRRLDEHLRSQYVVPERLAGTLTLVARRGKVGWLSPLGLMDRERGKPVRPDTIFRIYSMTKPVTSVAMMTLYERGLFQLADPVHRWIPAWENLAVYRYGQHPHFKTDPTARPMTIRDLLTHMAGLSYVIAERSHVDAAYRKLGVGDGKSTLSEMISRLSTLPLEYSPGTRWGYSVATDVLGYLVEVMSGEPLDSYFKRTILDPLGMVDTGFVVPQQSV